MTLNQFRNMFPDEGACRKYLEKVIWPSGRVCPHCGCLESWRIKGDSARPGLYECSCCAGHAGYQTSQKVRKRVEEIFGWMKTAGLLRKTRHRGLERVECTFTLAATAHNLVRMRNLIWEL